MKPPTTIQHLKASPRVRLWCLLLAPVCAALVGCMSGGPSEYVSPRVTGRVLAADTRQPLANVTVRRVKTGQPATVGEMGHGAQVLESDPTVRTDRQGCFVLPSVREVALLKHHGWYAVTLSFEHARYAVSQAEYTLGHSTNTPSGEPWVQAGDILLHPLSK
jgi:hypothetical protein